MTALSFQAAPTTSAEKRPEDRRTEFVAVEGGSGPTSSAETLVVVAYLVMWALLIGFIWLTFRRSKDIEARVDVLERALNKRDGEKS